MQQTLPTVMRQALTIILTVILALSAPCRAQDMRHSDQLTSYDGLGHETVFKMYKDREGLMWLGTNRGVRSYNGHAVRRMGGKGETGFVYTICETPDNSLLAGCATGLYAIDRDNATLRRIAPDIAHVNSICCTQGNGKAEGSTLVGGNGGLWIKENDRYKALPIESSVISKGNAVTDIVADGHGGAWISTSKRMVHITLPDCRMRRFRIPDSLLTNRISRIGLVGETLYIGTSNDGVLAFSTRTHRTGRVASVPSGVIADINTDGKRYVYVATDGNGAYTLDTKTGRITDERHGKTNAVYTFWKDTDLGISCFGYYLEGFSHSLYSRKLAGTYRRGTLDTGSLPVRSFCRHGGMMAIGTRKGLYIVDESSDSIRHFTSEELGATIVTNIKHFANHFIVATYDNGLRVVTTGNRRTVPIARGSFSRLCLSPDGTRLFAIGNMGVIVLDARLNIIRRFTCKNSELPDEYLIDIIFDKTGKAWISSMSHLCVYDPLLQTIQSSGFPKGFFNNEPSLKFALAADGDMLAWSKRKLYKAKVDFSAFSEIPLSDDFHIEEICFIRWHGGKYWIGTEQGLFTMDKDFKSGAKHLSQADGLPSLRFQSQEFQTTGDGTIWMATDGGIVMMTAGDSRRIGDSIPGKVVLNGTTWDGSRLAAFQPLLLNYSTDLGKMYEWTMDGGETHVCMDGETVMTEPQRWGTHTLRVWLLGHPETQMELRYFHHPSILFWACVAIIILTGLSIWLARRQAVDSYKTEEDKRRRIEEEARRARLYERQRLSDNEAAAIYNKVDSHIAATHCFTDPTLRLSDVAGAVGCLPAKLSQMFSMHRHQSFAEYINRLRVDEFKARAADKRYDHYSTVALAEMCGLKKSAFFAAFKRYEGCTPNEWMERSGIERGSRP